jgi:hypothetical protein
MKLYKKIARTLQAIDNCRKSNNQEWYDIHERTLRDMEELLPSGSGFDTGTIILLAESTPNRIVLFTSYHHMDNGFYTRWTNHQITITPSLVNEFEIKISGRNYDGIKDYIAEVFQTAMDQDVD